MLRTPWVKLHGSIQKLLSLLAGFTGFHADTLSKPRNGITESSFLA
jgi:hypothetical protein